MGKVLCAANAANMRFYFNEEAYGILPKPVKEELKVICVLYCADVGGIISLEFTDAHKLRITTMEPIDEIGAELRVKEIQRKNQELFEMLEQFDEEYSTLQGGAAEETAGV